MPETIKKRNRGVQVLLGTLLAAGILTATLLILLPRIVSTEWVRESVQEAVVEALDMQTGFDRLELTFLPRPRLELQQVVITSGTSTIRVPLLRVFPRVFPLFTGHVEIYRVDILEPVVFLDFSAFERGERDPGPGFEIAAIPEIAKQGLSGIPTFPGAVKIGISAGTVELQMDQSGERRIIRDLDSEISLRGQVLNLSASFDSEFARDIQLNVQLDGSENTGDVKLEIPGLDPVVLARAMSPGTPISLSGSPVDLVLSARIDTEAVFETAIRLKTDALQFGRQGQDAVYAGLRVDGAFSIKPDGYEISIQHLRTEKPSFDLSGNVQLDPAGDIREFTLGARRADLSAVAGETRFWGIANEALEEIFSILRTGDLSGFRLSAVATGAPPDFGPGAFTATGVLENGEIVLPLPDVTFRNAQGNFRLTDGVLQIDDLQGKLGNSSISKTGLKANLLDDKVPVELQSTIDVDLKEALEITRKLPLPKNVAPMLSKISNLRGRAAGQLTLNGPLLSPEPAFKLKLSGLKIDHENLPGPASIASGKMTLSGTVLSADKLKLALLDGALTVSGRMRGSPAGPEELEVRLDGRLGDEVIGYLNTFEPLPEAIHPQTPIELANLRVRWKGNGPVNVSGTATAPADAKALFDVSWAPGRILLRQLAFLDGEARAELRAELDPEAVEIQFHGTLNQETLNKYFKRTDDSNRSARGNFLLRAKRSPPFQFHLEGDLLLENVYIPYLIKQAPLIKMLKVESGEDRTLLASELVVAGSTFSADGWIRSGPVGLDLDLDILSPDADLAALADLFPAGTEPEGKREKKPGKREGIPVNGSIRFRADKARFDPWLLEPLAARITLMGRDTEVRIEEAALCGIAVTGELFQKQGGAQSLAIDLASSRQDLNASYRCLLQQEAEMAGTFDLTGRFQAETDGGPLLDALRGDYRFVSRKGRIYKMGILTELVATLNVTELLRGRKIEIGRDGLPYDEWLVEGRLEGHRLIFQKIVFSGPTLKIAGDGEVRLDSEELKITLLVSPLRTVDAAIGLVPLVGGAVENTLLSVGVKVRGTLGNPKTAVVPASTIGGGIVGTMTNILKLPFTIFEPKDKK